MNTSVKKNIKTKKNKKINKKQTKKIPKIYKNKGGALIKSKETGQKIYVKNINADIITVIREKFTIKFLKEGEKVKIGLDKIKADILLGIEKVLEKEGYTDKNKYLEREDLSMEEKMDKMNGIIHFIEGYLVGIGYKKRRSAQNELPLVPQIPLIEKELEDETNDSNTISSSSYNRLNTDETETIENSSIYNKLKRKPATPLAVEEQEEQSNDEVGNTETIDDSYSTLKRKPAEPLEVEEQEEQSNDEVDNTNLNVQPRERERENVYMNINQATPESKARVEGTYMNPEDLVEQTPANNYLEIEGTEPIYEELP